jgi:DNA (cytosine-5)-methyltransferase 1
MTLGFQKAGYDVAAGFDNWDVAISVYKLNFDHSVYRLDLSDEESAVNQISRYNPDVIVGGPPCQDFSIAGKRKEQSRANLTVSFSNIVCAICPKIFVMENVYSIEKTSSLALAKSIFKHHGYGLTSLILDSSLANVPQKRKRFFLIGMQNVNDDHFKDSIQSKLSSKSLTVYEYFKGKIDVEHYYAHPRNYKRRAVFSVHEPSSTIRRVNRPIPSNYIKHPADKADISEFVRPLTTEERSRIQTFPTTFKFVGSKSQQEQMIGNAVPVNLAEYVARRIKESL